MLKFDQYTSLIHSSSDKRVRLGQIGPTAYLHTLFMIFFLYEIVLSLSKQFELYQKIALFLKTLY